MEYARSYVAITRVTPAFSIPLSLLLRMVRHYLSLSMTIARTRVQLPWSICNLGVAPNDDRESAILATFVQGNYTAVVRGKNNGTGVGLVELYNVP